MTTERRWDCVLKGIGWIVGGVDLFLLVAVGLALFAELVLTLGDVPHAVVSFYLANWLFVFGLAGAALTAVWLLIKAATVCRVRAS